MTMFYYHQFAPDDLKKIRLSPHFTAYEFRCRVTNDVKISDEVVNNMELIRHRLGGVKIYIVSGYRSTTPKSQHFKGNAVDFRTVDKSLRLRDVLPVVLNVFNRVGIYCWGNKEFATIHGDIYKDKGRLFWWHTPSSGYNYLYTEDALSKFIGGTYWEDLPI